LGPAAPLLEELLLEEEEAPLLLLEEDEEEEDEAPLLLLEEEDELLLVEAPPPLPPPVSLEQAARAATVTTQNAKKVRFMTSLRAGPRAREPRRSRLDVAQNNWARRIFSRGARARGGYAEHEGHCRAQERPPSLTTFDLQAS
jgi:hypothetical protein